jgi:hypothetical protein
MACSPAPAILNTAVGEYHQVGTVVPVTDNHCTESALFNHMIDLSEFLGPVLTRPPLALRTGMQP